MALYNPPTKGTTIEMPFLALVTRADPEFERRKYREVEYEFSGRFFLANPYQRGLFNRLSNVYPVGQPYGTLDTLIEENLQPTVGNSTPGLYEGVVTGSWS